MINIPENCILRARAVITMRGEKPARGKALLKPVEKIDNCEIVVRDGVIINIAKASPHARYELDAGDVCLAPPAANCHTHLQLSWLANSTLWGRGFTPWLKSMVPQLLQKNIFVNHDELFEACRQIGRSGTRYVGDVGGSIPGALGAAHRGATAFGLEVAHFCEWFGFVPSPGPWPPRCAGEIENVNDASPCGHALYSTSPHTLVMAKNYCNRHDKIFSFHLAESMEETELLVKGAGPLFEYYSDMVLPKGWKAPGLRPLALALKLGLLDDKTLAAHGVQLDDAEIDALAASGAALCLCPRSNANLGVGRASVRRLAERGVLLCLGTDGLTSCEDLNVFNDALYLREQLDIPSVMLLRMLTVNGARALGLGPEAAILAEGRSASFSVLPKDLEI